MLWFAPIIIAVATVVKVFLKLLYFFGVVRVSITAVSSFNQFDMFLFFSLCYSQRLFWFLRRFENIYHDVLLRVSMLSFVFPVITYIDQENSSAKYRAKTSIVG